MQTVRSRKLSEILGKKVRERGREQTALSLHRGWGQREKLEPRGEGGKGRNKGGEWERAV